jgi:GalNAc-alpha-(1->4)-GalNAc-alpha-(1->3)-diNAcBac-PP-undecaprenol alpha-1,4-N-acetyl-D-galactosaminyltransferase
MRILFVSGSFNQGGAEFQILSLANLMSKHGHEVYVIALTDYDFYKNYLSENKISFHCLSNNDKKLSRILQLSSFIKQYQPDAIIAFLKNTSLATILAKIVSGWKCKLLLGERTALVKPFRDFFHFSLWHYADVVTTNSVSKFEYFKKYFPLLRRKLSLVKNVYAESAYLLAENKEIIFDNAYMNIVYVGRVSPEKNIHKLISSFGRLANRHNNMRLHLFGDSKNLRYKQQLDNIISDAGISDLIFFRKAVSFENLKMIYKQADLICLLSDYEGFSNVLAESMMQGCIPLVSNIPENTQVVTPGYNGIVVDISDSESIDKGLIGFLSLDTTRIAEMRATNRRIISEFLDPEFIYRDYIKLLS